MMAEAVPEYVLGDPGSRAYELKRIQKKYGLDRAPPVYQAPPGWGTVCVTSVRMDLSTTVPAVVSAYLPIRRSGTDYPGPS